LDVSLGELERPSRLTENTPRLFGAANEGSDLVTRCEERTHRVRACQAGRASDEQAASLFGQPGLPFSL